MRMARKSLQDPPRPFRGQQDEEERPSRRPAGPKKAVNVSVDAAILKVAKEMGINLSQALEDQLRKLTEPERVRRWQKENKAFTDSYNAYIERNGIAGEELLDLDEPPV